MQVEHRSFQTQRSFGVEFEVSPTFGKVELSEIIKQEEALRESPRLVQVESGEKGWAESNSNNFWHVKYDSTCGPLGKKKDHGWEIASYVCKNGNEDIVWVSKIADALYSKRVETNKNCGMHIHAEVADFTTEQMGNLYLQWMMAEKVILHSLPKHRKNNRYAKPIGKKFAAVCSAMKTAKNGDQVWQLVQPNNFYPHENPQKKVALNSVGFAHGLMNSCHNRKTLELRLPECILHQDYVENWLRMYLHFLETTKKRGFIIEPNIEDPLDAALWILGLEEKNDEKFVILDEPLYNLKIWFLNRVMANAITRKMFKQARKKLLFITQL